MSIDFMDALESYYRVYEESNREDSKLSGILKPYSTEFRKGYIACMRCTIAWLLDMIKLNMAKEDEKGNE